jgi:microcystin degradation protein MlrC
LKIYIASIIQETNTLCPQLTGLINFERGYYLEGHEIKEKLRHTNTEISGFIEYLEQYGDLTLISGLAAWAVASGKIKREAFELLADRLIGDLEKHLPVDGILLSLHGALVSEGCDDCEGYLLERLREVVGSQTKIVSTLDYHAALTEKMVKMADVLVGFRTYPHVDFKETGLKAAQYIKQLLDGSPNPIKCYSFLPLVLPVENTETGSGPMSHAIKQLEQLDDRVMSCSLFCPQPWLDIKHTGVAVICYVDADGIEAVKAHIKSIMSYIWDSRELFFKTYPTINSILEQIDQMPKPVILVDSGDVISAGGTGDSTVIVREIINSNKDLSAVISIVDPKTVDQAFLLKIGEQAWFEIGSDEDYGFNKRVKVYAKISEYSEGYVQIKGASFSGIQLNLGRRVLLTIRSSIQLIVSEYPTLIHDAEVLRKIGIQPESQDIIVQKSHKLFRDSYQNIAKSVELLDTPGFTDLNLKRLEFKNIDRPLYPFDEFELNHIPFHQF